MAYLVRIESVDVHRVWWEVRETAEDVDVLAESIEGNHPGSHVVTACLLDDGAPPEGWVIR